MPAELERFLFVSSAQWTNHSYMLFVDSFHHRVATGALLNAHGLDQIILGDLRLKLFGLVFC